MFKLSLQNVDLDRRAIDGKCIGRLGPGLQCGVKKPFGQSFEVFGHGQSLRIGSLRT